MRVVGCYEDTDGQGTEDVEEQYTPKDTTNSLGDILTRVLGFTSCDSNQLDTTV
jgi:hypothetical protein